MNPLKFVSNVFSTGLGRMPTEQPKSHERYRYESGRIIVELSPLKDDHVKALCRAAVKKRDEAIEAAETEFANVRATAKKAFDDAIANALPLRNKAIADATAEFEATEQQLLGAGTQPLPSEQLAKLITAATPENAVVDFRNVSPQAG